MHFNTSISRSVDVDPCGWVIAVTWGREPERKGKKIEGGDLYLFHAPPPPYSSTGKRRTFTVFYCSLFLFLFLFFLWRILSVCCFFIRHSFTHTAQKIYVYFDFFYVLSGVPGCSSFFCSGCGGGWGRRLSCLIIVVVVVLLLAHACVVHLSVALLHLFLLSLSLSTPVNRTKTTKFPILKKGGRLRASQNEVASFKRTYSIISRLLCKVVSSLNEKKRKREKTREARANTAVHLYREKANLDLGSVFL
eukprot:gene3817-2703_t